MISKTLQVESITSTDLLTAVSQLLDTKLQHYQSKEPTAADAYITRQDVAAMFKITLPTVHAWINAKILTPYKIGNRTRFKLSEVKAAAVNGNGKKGVIND